MHSDRSFTPDAMMSALVADDYRLLHVMSRFGIPVGFGEKSVRQVCESANVDCATFLAVANFMLEGYSAIEETGELSVSSLLRYLRASHTYFLDSCLPEIHDKLINALGPNPSTIGALMIKFLDEYISEVRMHMDYEEATVFSYVESLLRGDAGAEHPDYKISIYSSHHEQVASRLSEFKKLILRYCPEGAEINLLNSALYDIYRCEEELENHCAVEDCIFTPAVMAMERRSKQSNP